MANPVFRQVVDRATVDRHLDRLAYQLGVRIIYGPERGLLSVELCAAPAHSQNDGEYGVSFSYQGVGVTLAHRFENPEHIDAPGAEAGGACRRVGNHQHCYFVQVGPAIPEVVGIALPGYEAVLLEIFEHERAVSDHLI